MKRRTFIATSTLATTGVIGGCSGISPFGDGEAVDDMKREVSLERPDDITEREFDIGVELRSGQVDSESTARLEIIKTNTGDRRSVWIPQGPLFGWEHAGSQPTGLWLYNQKTTATAMNYKKDGRWTIRNDPPYDPQASLHGASSPVVYEQGETVSHEYELWDDYLVDGYFPTGTFRFEGPISIWESADREESAHSRLHWGFSIEVTT